jgi:hypothetical protein
MGMFDLDLAFSQDGLYASAAPGDEAVSIFTALQEQLGLKLESTTGPVDVFGHRSRPASHRELTNDEARRTATRKTRIGKGTSKSHD